MTALKNTQLSARDIQDIFNNISNISDDRTAAIIAVETISAIAKQLQKQVLNMRGEVSETLYRTADLLDGTLPTALCKEIQKLNTIRNRFAHCPLSVTFEHPEITENVKSLRITSEDGSAATLDAEEFGTTPHKDAILRDEVGFVAIRITAAPPDTTRNAFLYSAAHVCIALASKLRDLTPASAV